VSRSASLVVLALTGALLATGCGGGPGVEAVGAATETGVSPAAARDEIPLEGPPRDTLDPSASPGSTVAAVTAPELPGTVAVVGDSLTESAAAEIEATLTQNGVEVVALDGRTNRRMARSSGDVTAGTIAVDAILATLDDPPDMWVIALGTNDVGGAATPEEFAADMRALLDRLPAGAPVVWVDVWIRDMPGQMVDANAVIREVIGGRDDGHVADWYSRGGEGDAITADGVHLTGDGRWIFARTIIDAITEIALARAEA
jgi:lysophospholipase L1-like esterase